MMNNDMSLHITHPRRLKVQLWIALLIALSLTGLMLQPVAADDPALTPAQQHYEVRFMQGMIDHHAMAVEMAEICLQKAIDEELRSLCEQIIASQSQEISLMQSWLSDWYGITYEPQMKPGDMKMLERLAALSGSEFEIAFLEDMIRHHQKAIHEAEQCVEKAYHSELVALCQNIIAAQAAEIQQMEAWLCDWYGICA
jgi:uncharacterized protein (DUF305 family)